MRGSRRSGRAGLSTAKPGRGDELELLPALSFLARLRGLYSRGSLGPMQGLYLSPCLAVHTAWLTHEIDVVFLNRRGEVIRCVSRLKPWRFAVCLRAGAVVELRAGFCEANPAYASLIRRALEAGFTAPPRSWRRKH